MPQHLFHTISRQPKRDFLVTVALLQLLLVKYSLAQSCKCRISRVCSALCCLLNLHIYDIIILFAGDVTVPRYNNVTRGHFLNISCSTESNNSPFWRVMIGNSDQTDDAFDYHDCLNPAVNNFIGDLNCSATMSNDKRVVWISMTVNDTVVLQCRSVTCASRAIAYFVHTDTCTG